ncbi:hypothetical protein FQA39_LY11200 [Lamprigera yunnana]|nr:hypothetical protein FQA39_LY11200 [Lamprigera yunnana]
MDKHRGSNFVEIEDDHNIIGSDRKINQTNKLYDRSDPNNAEKLYQMLMESDNEGDEIEFEDDGDIECEDLL